MQPATPLRWFALLGGAVAWVVHMLVSYVISEFVCVGGPGGKVAWLLIGVSVALVMVAIAATIVGYRGRADDYLYRAGAIFSGLFAVIIAVETIPPLFYLDGCG